VALLKENGRFAIWCLYKEVTFGLPTTTKSLQINFTLKIESVGAGETPILPLSKTVYVWPVYGGFPVEASLECAR
jgi:hypothetical protein